MIVFEKKTDYRAWRKNLGGTVGFVPTMGALHSGHAELLKRARMECDHVVLSVFVNPTQFGPNEDFSKYPRAFQADCEIARACGVDAVFHPDVTEMYGEGFSTFVEETHFSQGLCGDFRPGHFRGVATVVLKLFQILSPSHAYFGMKDAQQFFLVEQMASDLDCDVKVIGVETIRESDGLAMSSRNRYLSEGERKLAPLIYAELVKVKEGSASVESAKKNLESQGFQVQYFDSRLTSSGKKWVSVAAFLGKTRLIDNVIG